MKTQLYSFKAKPLQVAKMRTARKGERTLTAGDKKNQKLKVNHKCQRCKKMFEGYLLEVHHKKGVATYKHKDLVDLPYLEFYNKRKKKAHYDKDKNLMVLCLICHKEVHKEESDLKKQKKKEQMKKAKKKQSIYAFGSGKGFGY